MSDVVVFSPSRLSRYTLCVTGEFVRRGLDVAGVVVRRLVNPPRFRDEFRRDGVQLLRKIWEKAILRDRAHAGVDHETIADYRQRLGIEADDVDELCAERDIPVEYCWTLNDDTVVEFLERTRPEVVVFTGGGLIRSRVLERSGEGIVHCHMGILPEYRGMDTVEWPILRGDFDRIGLTVQFMDDGIDTGDVLRTIPVEPRPDETVDDLRDRLAPKMCRELTDGCVDYLQGRLERTEQDASAGRQYYRMHPALKEVAERKYRRARGTDG